MSIGGSSVGTVVVCGAGIIGSSVAYYLSQHGVPCTVVERCHPACAASGRAGGFLARDWCDQYELGPLARASYDLHLQLAQTFPNTDFRRLDTLYVTASEEPSNRKSSISTDIPDWLDGHVTSASVLGSMETTAQVHPYKLTHCFLEAAKQKAGSTLLTGVVEGLTLSSDKAKVTGVKVNGEVIPADVVVIALGPWSGQASRWLNLPPIRGQKAHSVILKPVEGVTPTAVHMDYYARRGQHRSPEIYPRPDGDVFVCGMSDSTPLPEDPASVTPNPVSCDTLVQMASKVSSRLSQASLQTKSACYLPVSPDGLPLIGKVPGVEGAFVAAGHSCWGILNAPASGAALAELITTGKCTSVDLEPFNPARFF